MGRSLHNSPLSVSRRIGNTPIELAERTTRVGLRGGRYTSHSLAEKLAARLTKQPSGCWEIAGHALHSGHVHLSIGSPSKPPYIRVRAHVFAWEQANGRKVPAGLVVMHTCDNPRCVNPAHLRVGTQRDNIIDSVQKGRYNAFGVQKLNAAQVLEIRALAAAGLTQKAIAARFHIARNTVSQIVHRKTWDHVPRPFVPSGVSGEQVSNDVLERVPSVQLEIRGTV